MKRYEQMRHARRRRTEVPFRWPQPPLHIVLVEPAIPPNTGNIARLCAATGTILHLVEPLGFELTEKRLRRAGLDYWDAVDIRVHADFEAYLRETGAVRRFFFTTSGRQSLFSVRFAPGDHLVFGNETRGLSDELLERFPEQAVNIPQRLDCVRSLNLSSSAAVALYEALRQIDAGAAPPEPPEATP